MMKWEGFGWLISTITKVNEDARRTHDGKMINFFVLYDDEEDDRQALNIMYDKRVFRGNTHNLNILKQNLTPA